MDSPLTTEWEKDKFRATGLQRSLTSGTVTQADTRLGRLAVLPVLMNLNTVFDRDQIKRGTDVPPSGTQSLDQEGTVEETTTCDTYGNVTAMPWRA